MISIDDGNKVVIDNDFLENNVIEVRPVTTRMLQENIYNIYVNGSFLERFELKHFPTLSMSNNIFMSAIKNIVMDKLFCPR